MSPAATRRIRLLALGVLGLGLQAVAALDGVKSLTPWSRDGAWGYVDVDAQWAIKPVWLGAEDFREGLAAVECLVKDRPSPLENGKRWGFIDEAGQLVIPARWDAAKAFSEGRAFVKAVDGWHLIDRTGKLVAAGPWKDVQSFHEGRALVWNGADFRYIGLDGNPAFAGSFQGGDRFSEGVAPVKRGKVWGFIDRGGSFVAAPQWTKALAAHAGMAPVRKAGEWTLLATGSAEGPSLAGRWDRIEEGSEGLWPARRTELWGFIDASGNWRVRAQFRELGGMYQGLARARDAETKLWGYVGPEGNWLIKPSLSNADDFKGALAAVKYQGKKALIDRRGRLHFP